MISANLQEMNYLAHAYLSFGLEEILVGNMISDFVKGNKQYGYGPGIQQGIRLHRSIDAFTDAHEATRTAKEFFRKDYRLYAGAFVDVVYDHFLANDPTCFPAEADLRRTADLTYDTLQLHYELLPEKMQQMLPYMRSQDWLFNYRFEWGIEKSLMGVVRRSRYLDSSVRAFEILQANMEPLRQCYAAFFPEMKAFAAGFIAP